MPVALNMYGEPAAVNQDIFQVCRLRHDARLA